MHARPAPRESMRDERNRGAAFSPRPVSGLAIYRAAFPRVMRSGMIACCRTLFRVPIRAGNNQEIGKTARLRTDLQLALRSLTVAGAAQVGSSWRTSLPASRLTAHTGSSMREHQGARSLRAAPRSVKKAGQCGYAGPLRTVGAPLTHSIERSIHRRFNPCRAVSNSFKWYLEVRLLRFD